MAKKEPKPLSERNTKKEILASYHELMEEFKKQGEQTLDPKKVIQEIKENEADKVVDELTTETVIEQISSLKSEISTLLGKLADLMESGVSKYAAIQLAIEAKGRELREVYGVEKEAGSLAVLIEAQRQKKDSFEEEMAERTRILEEVIQSTRTDWEKEKNQYKDSLVEGKVLESRKRQREKEEFDYEFEREKRRVKDQFEDGKAKFAKETAAQKEILEQKETALSARERELADLESRIQAFPTEIEKAVSKAVKGNSEQLNRESAAREELAEKIFEGENRVLATRIESLEKTIKEQATQITKLTQYQEKAYGQVQEIAIKAVEGASNLKSIFSSIRETESGKKEQEK